MGVGNLYTILSSGRYNIPVDKEELQRLKAFGLEYNDGYIEIVTAMELEKDNPDEALKLYQRALSHGEEDAYYYMGKMYTYGGVMSFDFWEAHDLFHKGIESGSMAAECHMELGKIYYYGGSNGMLINYKNAVKHFLASREECNWAAVMLGTCYLKGQGVKCDYSIAREIFESYPDEIGSVIGLGEIYAYGLGVTVDIPRAMEYWDKYPENEDIIANRKNFQKTVAGWKQIKQHQEYNYRGIKKILIPKNMVLLILCLFVIAFCVICYYENR